MRTADSTKWPNRLIDIARRRVTSWLSAVDASSDQDTLPFAVANTVTFAPSAFGVDGYDIVVSDGGGTKDLVIHAATSNDIQNAIAGNGGRLKNIVSIRPSAYRPVTVTANGHIYQCIRPIMAFIDETVEATYGGDGLPDVKLYKTVPCGEDVLLFQAYVGNCNLFPNAPDLRYAISGPALSRASVNGMPWPVMYPGIDFSAGFAIERSVLSRTLDQTQTLSPGYDRQPKLLSVTVRLNLVGRHLR